MWRLRAQVVPADKMLDRAIEVAGQIAGMSQPVVNFAKEAVDAAYEMTLTEGNKLERKVRWGARRVLQYRVVLTYSLRQLFYSCFGCADQSEGMTAFVEKRKPNWQHK